MKEDKRVYVIILNWNGFEMTKECVKSFNFVSTPHQIVIVDNGSTDGSAHKLKAEFSEHTLIENEHNLGYAGGNNVGLEYALEEKAPFILVLNNDTVVAPDMLDRLIEAEEKAQGKTVLGCRVVDYYQRHQLDHLGGVWNEQSHNFDLVGKQAPANTIETIMAPLDYITGCALFARGSTFEQVGLFDDRYFLFWEEVDWCYRAKQLGFNLSICHEATLYHKGSASFEGGAPHKAYFWWRSRLLWLETHKNSEQLVIKAEVPRLFYQYCLAHLHLLGYALTIKRDKLRKKRGQIKRLKASLRGVMDYKLKRFDQPPKSLITRDKRPFFS